MIPKFGNILSHICHPWLRNLKLVLQKFPRSPDLMSEHQLSRTEAK